MTPADRILAAKAAQDNGWEIPPVDERGWLRCASARFDAVGWVNRDDVEPFRFHVSSSRLLRELRREYPPSGTTDTGAGGVLAEGIEALDGLMRRAARIARALPHNAAREYQETLKTLKPNATEVERLVLQRVGQNIFRAALLDYWRGACAVTGLGVPELLRASHAKPWAKCDGDEERLDVFNGLLLAPHLDALFDGGWITFGERGGLITSPQLGAQSIELLNLARYPARLRWIEPEHIRYLAYHREHLFRG